MTYSPCCFLTAWAQLSIKTERKILAGNKSQIKEKRIRVWDEQVEDISFRAKQNGNTNKWIKWWVDARSF